MGPLYKLNSNGKMMVWFVQTALKDDGTADIITQYGQEGGAIQTTTDTVRVGKNIGRSNETTAHEQALAEAKSSWEIQQRINGYVSDRERAARGESDRGGYSPMLAQGFEKHKAKIKYPCAQQPKLDGMRCPAVVTAEDAAIFSRNGKPIKAVPHILEELRLLHSVMVADDFLAPDDALMPDGELYNHDLKHDFEKLISIARKDKEIDSEKKLQMHIYDLAGTNLPFGSRSNYLLNYLLMTNEDGSPLFKYLVPVLTLQAENEQQVLENDITFIEQGYEASMVRNLDSLYQEDKRSFDLQKVKLAEHGVFEDAEFRVIGVTEGRGKLMGHAATFVCLTEDGKEFKAKLEGELGRLKSYFEDAALWKNKVATVRFQGRTAENIPRFPVAKVIRDYE